MYGEAEYSKACEGCTNPHLHRSRELPWIRSRNVPLECLDGLCLTRDDPFHQVANRDQTYHGFIQQHRKMAKTVLGHNRHAFVHSVLGTDEKNRAGHDLVNPGFPGGLADENSFARVVTLGKNSDQVAVRKYQ